MTGYCRLCSRKVSLEPYVMGETHRITLCRPCSSRNQQVMGAAGINICMDSRDYNAWTYSNPSLLSIWDRLVSSQ
jgi:hypothetical protein